MKNKRLEERRKKIPEYIDKAVKYYFDRIDDKNRHQSSIEILITLTGYSELELTDRLSEPLIQPIDALTAMTIVKLLAKPAVSVAEHPLPRPLEAWKNAREMELSDYIEWHLEQERRGNAR